MVNLEKHKVYVDIHKMDMVPYTIAVQAVEEASKEVDIVKKLDKMIKSLSSELTSIDPNIDIDND
tara:strand:+ start:161 stop:355 length:195 start_codon:yes stop_codon:yes gene_type:complete